MKTEIKSLSDAQLVQNLKNLVQKERTLLTEILWHLKEIDDRKIHLTLSYPSLFEYAVQVLHYSESQAYRRIAAMRILRDTPEIEAKLDSGELKLTQLTVAQEYFRSENKKGVPVSPAAKMEILEEISEKSSRETERYFAALAPELCAKDKTRAITENQIEIKFIANQKLLDKLNRFKEIDAHVKQAPNYAELFERLVDLALKQKDPEVKATRLEKRQKSKPVDPASVFSAQKKPIISRFIPADLKRAVLARDHGQCTYRSPTTGKICGSRYQIEIDHVLPVAKNGESNLENLRCLCRQHNLHEATRIFGAEKMRSKTAKAGCSVINE